MLTYRRSVNHCFLDLWLDLELLSLTKGPVCPYPICFHLVPDYKFVVDTAVGIGQHGGIVGQESPIYADPANIESVGSSQVSNTVDVSIEQSIGA